MYMDQKKINDEMMEIVQSDEAEEVYRRTIITNDSKAFTGNGVIQTYKVDKDSIKKNPKGGIMVNLIINDNSKLVVDVILQKDEETGMLRNSSGGVSTKLDMLLKGESVDEN